ncbi:MAG: hypothetical protein ACYDEN_06200 [Acidimicrobiales bacterium]
MERAITGPGRDEEEEGGDPACWAGLLCPECAAVVGRGEQHTPGCPVGVGSTS